jgi:hypothetical protein
MNTSKARVRTKRAKRTAESAALRADLTAAAVVPVEAVVDGERVTIEAEHELELRCGKASIVLRASGEIVIRGASLLSRSSGANRIKGATVEIN